MKISDFPKLNNLEGEIVIPIITIDDYGTYHNYNITPAQLILISSNIINEYIQNYIHFNKLDNNKQVTEFIKNIEHPDLQNIKTQIEQSLKNYIKFFTIEDNIKPFVSSLLTQDNLSDIKEQLKSINDLLKNQIQDINIINLVNICLQQFITDSLIKQVSNKLNLIDNNTILYIFNKLFSKEDSNN